MNFRLQKHLDTQHRATVPRFAFSATNADELELWQNDFRKALADVLAIDGRFPSDNPQTEHLSTQDKGSYLEEKHLMLVDDVSIPMYLLIPKTPPPYKVILAFHGHAPSVHQILGNYPDAETRQKNIERDENFAQRLANDGYFVCAIEQRGFGERITDQITPKESRNSCRHLAFEYLLHGRVLLGERVRDGMACINYLQSRDDIVMNPLGCTGHSGGAMTALFLSTLDTRVTVNTLSGYFCDYRHSILGMAHCDCNYVPNLLTLGGIGEITALLAPRPLRIINGKNDPIFPIAGVDEPYQVVQQAYEISHVPESISLVFHQGEHLYDYQESYSWFQQWM